MSNVAQTEIANETVDEFGAASWGPGNFGRFGERLSAGQDVQFGDGRRGTVTRVHGVIHTAGSGQSNYVYVDIETPRYVQRYDATTASFVWVEVAS